MAESCTGSCVGHLTSPAIPSPYGRAHSRGGSSTPAFDLTEDLVRVQVLSAHILEYADVQECVTGLGRILRNWKAVLE